MSNRSFYGICGALVVVIILLVTVAIPHPDQKRSVDGEAATKTLRDLVSRTHSGLSYDAFGDRLGDARSAIDAYERSHGSDPVSASFEAAYKHFAFSKDVWDTFKAIGNSAVGDDSIILVNYYSSNPTVSKLLAEHPEVEFSQALSLHKSLSAVWGDGSKAVSSLPQD